MSGPRGERARRRVLAPRGRAWIEGDDGPRVLRYPAGDLVVVGGPSGAGKSTLVARAVDGARVPVLDPDDVRAATGEDAPWPAALAHWEQQVAAALAAGHGAVGVATALGQATATGSRGWRRTPAATPTSSSSTPASAPAVPHRRAARIPDGLVEHLHGEWLALRRALAAPGDPAGVDARFASVTVLDRAAAARIRRIRLGGAG